MTIHVCTVIILGPVNFPGSHAVRVCVPLLRFPWHHVPSLLMLWRAR